MSKPLYAPQVWRSLNGVLCVFKPPNTPLHRLSASIKNRILVGFANIPNYKYEYREALWKLELEASRNQQNISNDTTDSTAAGTNQGTALLQGNSSSELAQAMSNLELPVPPSQHRLVRGIRYVEPPKLWDIHPLADISSGVSLYFLGRDRFMYHDMITDAKYLRVYHVSGLLGRMTDDYTVNGRLVQRTSFSHITKPKLDKICVYTQQTHQKHMFDYADLAPDSEEAYEVAKRGLIRPTSELSPPILYGVKCIQFDPPNFTLEIHSINETCAYLCNLVHDIGVHLKSSATTTKVKRIRYGIFNLDHTLVKYQMNLVSIQENIRMCNEMLTPDRLFTDSNLGNQKKSFNRNKETKSLEGKCSDLKADKFDKEENPDKETEKIIKTNSKHK